MQIQLRLRLLFMQKMNLKLNIELGITVMFDGKENTQYWLNNKNKIPQSQLLKTKKWLKLALVEIESA